MTLTIRAARPDDVEAWIALARALEPLFGPMADVPEFRDGLKAAITDGTALVAAQEERFAGAIVVDRASNAVAWLGVETAARGQGGGTALLRAALAMLDAARPVAVQTFAPQCVEGAAARALYKRMGFTDAGNADPTPAGIATVVMIRPAGG